MIKRQNPLKLNLEASMFDHDQLATSLDASLPVGWKPAPLIPPGGQNPQRCLVHVIQIFSPKPLLVSSGLLKFDGNHEPQVLHSNVRKISTGFRRSHFGYTSFHILWKFWLAKGATISRYSVVRAVQAARRFGGLTKFSSLSFLFTRVVASPFDLAKHPVSCFPASPSALSPFRPPRNHTRNSHLVL